METNNFEKRWEIIDEFFIPCSYYFVVCTTHLKLLSSRQKLHFSDAWYLVQFCCWIKLLYENIFFQLKGKVITRSFLRCINFIVKMMVQSSRCMIYFLLFMNFMWYQTMPDVKEDIYENSKNKDPCFFPIDVTDSYFPKYSWQGG